MDYEINEGVDLGTMLIISVAIIMITGVICGVCRQSFIDRDKEVTYLNSVTESFAWEELHAGVVIPNMDTKYIDGVPFARILYQDISNNTNYFTIDNCLDIDRPGLYSKLSMLEYFRGPDGMFEFILDYPDSTEPEKYNRWKQHSNPVTEQKTNGTGSGVNANGFTPIHMDWPAYGGKGIEFNGVNCVLDGIVNHNNWWLCVGILNKAYSPTATATKPWTMPGAYTASGGEKGISKVELWVKMYDEPGVALDALLKWLYTYDTKYPSCICVKDPMTADKYEMYTNFVLTNEEKTKMQSMFNVSTISERMTSYDLAQIIIDRQQQAMVNENTVLSNVAIPTIFEGRGYFSMPIVPGMTADQVKVASGFTTIADDYVITPEHIIVFVIN